MAGLGADVMRLWSGVFSPLVLGGRLAPMRPIGPSRARHIADAGAALAASERTWVDAMRVRRARPLGRVDHVEAPDASQWLMVAALNDLLQSTNPKLDGMLASRSGKLLELTMGTIGGVGAPASIREVISRHATFARLLELERVDTFVSWWAGSASFRGCPAPARMLAWKGLRRVGTRTDRTGMTQMCFGSRLDDTCFLEALQRLLQLTPLTDLATAHRQAPAFAWSRGSLGLILTHPGHTLASRALRSADPRAALAALHKDHPRVAGTPFEPAVRSVIDELAAYAGR